MSCAEPQVVMILSDTVMGANFKLLILLSQVLVPGAFVPGLSAQIICEWTLINSMKIGQEIRTLVEAH